MKAKLPPHRRKFRTEWDEICYLHEKLLYWLYRRQDAERARYYARRLERLLPRADPDHEAILGEECWSLVQEAKGDLRAAIPHRENEVRMIRRLHVISRNSPVKEYLLQRRGYDNLSDTMDVLATLYHDTGQLDKALRILRESRRLCRAHGIPFDGEELLREYLDEKGNGRETMNHG
jgi:hypothetical protein